MRLFLAIALCLMAVGCGAAAATSPAGSTPVARASVTDGAFTLTFELPRADWRASDAIDGVATLSLASGDAIDLGGSGGGLLGFAFSEVNGTRHVEPVSTADCGPHRLEPGKPITSTIKKSGAFSADQPDADFYGSFFADPVVHLPAGDWDISAIATFAEGEGCRGKTHEMKATVRVHVEP